MENANKIELIMTSMPGKHIHIIKGKTPNTIVGIMQQSFLYGVSELNKTAVELTRNKMAFLAASNLHRRY